MKEVSVLGTASANHAISGASVALLRAGGAGGVGIVCRVVLIVEARQAGHRIG